MLSQTSNETLAYGSAEKTSDEDEVDTNAGKEEDPAERASDASQKDPAARQEPSAASAAKKTESGKAAIQKRDRALRTRKRGLGEGEFEEYMISNQQDYTENKLAQNKLITYDQDSNAHVQTLNRRNAKGMRKPNRSTDGNVSLDTIQILDSESDEMAESVINEAPIQIPDDKE